MLPGLDGLDMLVNNAGNVKLQAGRRSLLLCSKMVRVHLLSAHHMAQACLGCSVQVGYQVVPVWVGVPH
ncbi:MAG: hypothetical protein IPK95_11740 [Cellvibrionales bacterium]|nr:hypothetical protein [Cellvibrionales bacterium]